MEALIVGAALVLLGYLMGRHAGRLREERNRRAAAQRKEFWDAIDHKRRTGYWPGGEL